MKVTTPHAANNRLKTLRALLEFAVEREWIEHNEASKVKKLKAWSEGFHTWSEEEVAQFEARWLVGTKQRLALDLLQYTGQRSADVRLMARGQMNDGTILVRQSKTRALLSIPVHPALERSIQAADGSGLMFLQTHYGEPYSEKGFSKWFSDLAKQAGLSGCTAHGLRKVAAVRMADAGCTAHEIMAVTGHKSMAEVQRYTAAASQKTNALAAMEKVRLAQGRRRMAE
ncbi:MAG: tyrosine-type recombinase/integrase [Caulobacter sp.]